MAFCPRCKTQMWEDVCDVCGYDITKGEEEQNEYKFVPGWKKGHEHDDKYVYKLFSKLVISLGILIAISYISVMLNLKYVTPFLFFFSMKAIWGKEN